MLLSYSYTDDLSTYHTVRSLVESIQSLQVEWEVLMLSRRCDTLNRQGVELGRAQVPYGGFEHSGWV